MNFGGRVFELVGNCFLILFLFILWISGQLMESHIQWLLRETHNLRGIHIVLYQSRCVFSDRKA